MSDFKKLYVWRKAHALALNSHPVIGKIRGNSSLRSQMTRAVMSISTNIVEGRVKGSDAEFARYLRISIGSATEFEYHLLLGHELGYVAQTDFENLLEETTVVRKMLSGLVAVLESKASPEVKIRKRLARKLDSTGSSPHENPAPDRDDKD
jgi:four helix bundle protein